MQIMHLAPLGMEPLRVVDDQADRRRQRQEGGQPRNGADPGDEDDGDSHRHRDVDAQKQTGKEEFLQAGNIGGAARDQLAGVGLVVIGEREALHGIEIGGTDILQRGLHDAVAEPAQDKSHDRPEQGHSKVLLRQIPWIVGASGGSGILQPGDGVACNPGQRHLQADVDEKQSDRERHQSGITFQKRKYSQEILWPEGGRFW